LVAGSGEQETKQKLFGEKECCDHHYFKSMRLPFKNNCLARKKNKNNEDKKS